MAKRSAFNPTTDTDQAVYLIHFSEPYKHAAHYIGWAKDLEERLAHHKNGTGARLTQVVVDAGILLFLARVWHGKDRSFERRLKNCHKPSEFCPICSGEAARNRMKG
jgi:predicted GIY-YIG superfamily endonuclease